MTTYALLHGGAHAGWAWELLAPCLEARGHQVLTPDLPMEDARAGIDAWASAACDAIDAATSSENVVVVGHSIAGLALPVVGARRAVRRLVFLCATVPLPGRPHAACVDTHPIRLPRDGVGRDFQGRMVVSWDVAREYYYGDCAEDLARRNWERLRPLALTVWRENCPVDAWPDVRYASLYGAADRSLDPEYSRQAARELLGVDAVGLPGGHSPMLARPEHLARVLDEIDAQ